MRTVIKGGTVVTASDTYAADVLIEDEQIAAVGRDLSGDATIDAGGAYVIPGGIDVHTHLEMPFGGTVSSDDFFTGHRAAAFGGTTTHLDFAIQPKGATLRETFDLWSAKASGQGGHRLRLPPRHHRSAGQHHGRNPAMPGMGRHQPQTLHGLQGRINGRRRHALPRSGAGGGARPPDDGPRREWRRHRHPRQSGRCRRAPRAQIPRAHPPPGARSGGDQSRHPPRGGGGRAALCRPRHLRRRARRGARGARAGDARLRRDLHAVLLLHQRRPRPPRLRGREVRLLAALPRARAISRRSGAASRTTPCR